MKKKNRKIFGALMILSGLALSYISQAAVGADSMGRFQSSINIATIYLTIGVGFAIAGALTLVLAFSRQK